MKKKQKNILKKYNSIFNNQHYIIFILFIGLIINLLSCKVNENKLYTIQGKIIIIGNEPFTKLAIIDKNQRVYQLNCEKKIKKILLDKQGEFVKLFYDKKEIINNDTILIITDIKINENKKNGKFYE